MTQTYKLTKEDKQRLKEYYLNSTMNMLYQRRQPRLLYVDTGQSVDKLYIMGEYPDGKLLIYYLGSLDVVSGFDIYGMPKLEGVTYNPQLLRRLVNKGFNQIERELVLTARETIKYYERNQAQ